MPPPFESPSMIAHFFGLALPSRAELTRDVARNRHGLAKHHLTDIDCDVLVRVDAFSQSRRGGRKFTFAFASIGIELDVREMQRQSFRRLDRRDHAVDASGKSKIAAMNMQRMRDADIDHGALQGLY